jgi:two-component system sensor kinase FixL
MDDMPADQRLLVVRTMPSGDHAVQVDVCDWGMGIGDEGLERLFQPFFTTKPEGMGMGLAISRSIVQAHGGRLWASANPTQGCTFHFTLPVSKKD